ARFLATSSLRRRSAYQKVPLADTRTEKSVIKSQHAWFFDKGATSVGGLSGISAIPHLVAISRDFNDGSARGACELE
ncbi:hypothetical protein ACIOGT_39670, partial [Streptomyces microflavus]|uniref:hypothetical protein n=1 Tax=Streptomyces microflavus TaxID=1919 RepID=UPI0038050202